MIEMIGKRFGRLVVIKKADRSKSGLLRWECLCDCGNIRIVHAANLRRGNAKSCGCLHKEIVTRLSTTHNMYSTPTYKSWGYMLSRCRNKKDTGYKDYGGRGIKVHKEWLKFERFFEDMGECPKGLTIERTNNELGYFKENCIWANRTTQARNQRIRQDNTTGIAGVRWNNKLKKYEVTIGVNHKSIFIGYFKILEQAAEARRQAESKYW